ncbi:hypothetical protein GCM10009786_11670 [Leucobacter alluvii]|uniref:ABC transmembrane type-1 domain-containing protein n=1 Tax=Leucobacter alluvii TaxID=340321 RepID=A0ABN3B6F6_9MICO
MAGNAKEVRLQRHGLPRLDASLPTWFYYLFFFILPVGLVFWYSFGYKPDLFTTHANDLLSFDRYVEVSEGVFFQAFLRTLGIAVLGTGLALIIGFPFAYWLSVKLTPKWRYVVLALVMIPYWTNFLIRTIGWQLILTGEGFLSQMLQAIGLIQGPLDVLGTSGAVQLGVVYNYLPMMILPLFVALERISPALREASYDLGAGRWRTLFQVTLPQAMPGIGAGLLLVFVPLMGDYITGTVLGGVKGTMVGQLVASDFLVAQDWARGSAGAIVLIITILCVVAVAALIWRITTLLYSRFNHIDVIGDPGRE